MKSTLLTDSNQSAIGFCSLQFDGYVVSNLLHLFTDLTTKQTEYITVWCEGWYFTIKSYRGSQQKYQIQQANITLLSTDPFGIGGRLWFPLPSSSITIQIRCDPIF